MGQASSLSIWDDRQDAGPTSNPLALEIATSVFQRGRNDRKPRLCTERLASRPFPSPFSKWGYRGIFVIPTYGGPCPPKRMASSARPTDGYRNH